MLMKRGHYVNDWDWLTLEDKNNRLFRNVGKQLPLYYFFFFFFFLRRYNFREVLAFSYEFLPFGPFSDAVLPVCYFRPCYIALYIILPSIFRSS